MAQFLLYDHKQKEFLKQKGKSGDILKQSSGLVLSDPVKIALEEHLEKIAALIFSLSTKGRKMKGDPLI